MRSARIVPVLKESDCVLSGVGRREGGKVQS